MELNLKGRRALVTGATAGIGRAIATSLAEEGIALALIGRRADLLADCRAECLAAGSPQTVAITIDMMAPDAPASAAGQAVAGLGGIDILINCMGASRNVALDEPEEVWEASMTLNWTRHRQLASQVLPAMQTQGWGRIINITGPNDVSIAGSGSTMGLNSAGVAKATVHAWAKGVSDLVARDGITVNCIGPGKINSEQIARNYTPERKEAVARANIPMGRFGEPQELADLVTFLVSPRASYITGNVIHVDGGMKRYMF